MQIAPSLLHVPHLHLLANVVTVYSVQVTKPVI